jgi:hypothetical protein
MERPAETIVVPDTRHGVRILPTWDEQHAIDLYAEGHSHREIEADTAMSVSQQKHLILDRQVPLYDIRMAHAESPAPAERTRNCWPGSGRRMRAWTPSRTRGWRRPRRTWPRGRGGARHGSGRQSHAGATRRDLGRDVRRGGARRICWRRSATPSRAICLSEQSPPRRRAPGSRARDRQVARAEHPDRQADVGRAARRSTPIQREASIDGDRQIRIADGMLARRHRTSRATTARTAAEHPGRCTVTV